MRVLLDKRYNLAKSLLFGKSGNYLVKGILCGKVTDNITIENISSCFYYLFMLCYI